MDKLVEIKDLTLTYKTKTERVDVFENFNLEIFKGEFLVILGPSGAGKSTLLNLIAGFLKPTSGEIIINNKDISKMNESDICAFRNKNIGYIFQFFNLIQEFTAKQNIEVPMLISKEKDYAEKVNEIIVKMGLEKRQNHYPEEMSGGEQQRVAIARALINNPELVLADEPTGNLDYKNTKNILEVLQQIYKDGKTIVVVTHDRDIAKLATRVIDFSDII